MDLRGLAAGHFIEMQPEADRYQYCADCYDDSGDDSRHDSRAGPGLRLFLFFGIDFVRGWYIAHLIILAFR
jgi:hypothetical protein